MVHLNFFHFVYVITVLDKFLFVFIFAFCKVELKELLGWVPSDQ